MYGQSPSAEVIAAIILVVFIVQVLIMIFSKELGLSTQILTDAQASCHSKMQRQDIPAHEDATAMRVYTLQLHPAYSRSMTTQSGTVLVLTPSPDSIALERDAKSGRVTHIMMQGTILFIVTTSRTTFPNEETEFITVSARPFQPVMLVGKTAYTSVPIPASSGIPSVIVSAPLLDETTSPQPTALCVVLGWIWLPS
jgi:hypothetical protein